MKFIKRLFKKVKNRFFIRLIRKVLSISFIVLSVRFLIKRTYILWIPLAVMIPITLGFEIYAKVTKPEIEIKEIQKIRKHQNIRP